MQLRRVITTALLGTWLVAIPAYAIFGVGDITFTLDAANLEQNVATVTSMATQIEQTKQMIQDQLTLVRQGANNLLATPLDMMNQLKSITDMYNSALADVKGIGYTMNSARQQWESLYGATTSTKSLPEKATAVFQAIQAASSQANQMQAIYDRLCQQATQMQTALAASKAAPGSLAAIQAQTQMNAVLSGQLDTLTKIEMTEARAHILQIADDARTSEQAVRNSQNWIRGFDDPDNTYVPFGQGKGRTLD